MTKVVSSYEENNYGEIFLAIMAAFEPEIVVELGVLNGYSTQHLAKGILKNGHGVLECYDLFEDYPYNHSQQIDVRKNLDESGFGFVKLIKADAFKVHERYLDGTVHLLHVDLSNTGETVKKIMETWDSKMVIGGIILFEGGSEERDQIEWMKKYAALPIKSELENNEIIKKYVFGTYLKYPSLTMLLKKR